MTPISIPNQDPRFELKYIEVNVDYFKLVVAVIGLSGRS